MPISLKPQHLKRYKDLALLLFKYGRADMVSDAGLAELLPQDRGPGREGAPEAEQLADDVENL